MSYSFDSKCIIEWFAKDKRTLPWRNQPTPYAVWVSEVMLQQTRASVVIPYFERWMERFPTVKDLARASVDEVMKQWEGLGYYSRARNLHRGARHLMEAYDGHLPCNPKELQKIPGLGPYTIGAILSFAFHQKATAVDGNVLRVLARYFMIADDISQQKTMKTIRSIAEDILPDETPWLFNEALIELGATICRPAPDCQQCPVKQSCRSFINGVENRFPIKSKQAPSIPLHRIVAVICCGEHFLVQRGKKGKIMHDLHEFPYFEVKKEGIDPDRLLVNICDEWGLKVQQLQALPTVHQTFTKYRVRLTPYLLKSVHRHPLSGYHWFSLQELDKLAFSSGHRKIFLMLNNQTHTRY